MTLFEKIQLVAKKWGGLKDIAINAGIGEIAIYRWKTSTPKTDKLHAVADVLGVTIDCLLSSDNKQPVPTKVDLADDTVILTYDGKNISPEDRELILRLMRGAKHDK